MMGHGMTGLNFGDVDACKEDTPPLCKAPQSYGGKKNPEATAHGPVVLEDKGYTLINSLIAQARLRVPLNKEGRPSYIG